jgi:vacuolar-type H+-ATPase subunit I/STV1
MRLDKVNPADYRMVPVDADPDFDPKRNQEVIDYTIKKSEELQRKKQREFGDKVKERTEAMSTYFEALKMGNTTSDYKKYFGKDYLSYLKGYELIDKLKKAKQINPNGSLMKRVNKFYASKTTQG